MTEPKDNREFITALSRGLRVLQAFDRDHAELTLSEVARLTDLSPGTARRCLITLQELGYVGANGKRFFLLPKVVSIGATYLDAARIDEIILPYLRELVATTGESSSLGVLDGEDVLHLANYSARRLIRMTAGVGSRFPAHATSLGRVLLADLPPAQLDEFLSKARLKQLTAKTVTDPAKLRRILKTVQKDGFARVVDELEEGLSSVAVPVRIASSTVAAINSSTFFKGEESARTTASRLAALRQAASHIARAVGRAPALLHSFGQG
jgi:IclR family pca regulon transcriptional regulator